MKIAVLSDIHGNYAAFEAVLNDLEKKGADGIIIAGDHFNDSPQPMQVFERLKTINAWVIKGNKEERILRYHNGEFHNWDKYLQMSAFIWTYRQFNGEVMDYIINLPEQLVVDAPGKDKIRVVHGSPFRINEDLSPDRDEGKVIKALQSIDEKVLVCGHTHAQWYRRLGGKLIVNPGSVGLGFNASASAEYSLLEWSKDHWEVQQYTVAYDKRQLTDIFYSSGYIEACGEYAKVILSSIKSGVNDTLGFLDFAYKLAADRGIKEKLVPNDIWLEAGKAWNWRSV